MCFIKTNNSVADLRINNTLKAPSNSAELIMADPDLTEFVALLTQAELIDSVQADYEQVGIVYPQLTFMNGLTQWTVLAPINSAVTAAKQAGLIPEEKEELKKWIYYHFVREKCVFDDGVFSGTVSTNRQDTVIGSDIIFETLSFTNAVYNLSVTDKTGQQVSIEHSSANKLIEAGVVHKINSVLSIE